jgi:hypothetical protein
VVYDIDAATGETRYPALKVVEVDGKERPLNEQEEVFQVGFICCLTGRSPYDVAQTIIA